MTLDTPAGRSAAPAPPLGFDPAALREEYRAERDKRLRPVGNDQYVEMTGRHAGLLGDPHVGAPSERAPLAEEVEVVVIGGG